MYFERLGGPLGPPTKYVHINSSETIYYIHNFKKNTSMCEHQLYHYYIDNKREESPANSNK